jgi:hypothetical protein
MDLACWLFAVLAGLQPSAEVVNARTQNKSREKDFMLSLSSADSRIRQLPPEISHTLLCDAGSLQSQVLQAPKILQVLQSRIGDLGIAQHELVKVLQSRQMHQSPVSDIAGPKAEGSQRGQRLHMRQCVVVELRPMRDVDIQEMKRGRRCFFSLAIFPRASAWAKGVLQAQPDGRVLAPSLGAERTAAPHGSA